MSDLSFRRMIDALSGGGAVNNVEAALRERAWQRASVDAAIERLRARAEAAVQQRARLADAERSSAA
jgi:hypothetical protein